ncbi:Mannosyl-glycoprotein endo-beta-N-acetylglucosaminidase [Geobacillus thermodenitrificans]|uniref:N-acetylglucosaminidase n=2 Tax=Geobacillus thermodenitrificans TaxID=33940 RepID=UPI000A290B29|nr:N-acetylglucosaminidase [Geobacillus thermodenitrificans]ARP44158.1 Mannosyl-glycoprotein endo-beta-N-acetylglucosaminidase [Geobacillus thermodenitrificans]
MKNRIIFLLVCFLLAACLPFKALPTSSVLAAANVTATSKLGRILEPSAVIYKTVGSSSGSFQAGTQYTDKVFYIKKQAAFDGQTYYLISTVASDTQGVVGWVNAKDMWAQNHVAVDHKEKLFYLKGTGWAYTNPWGAGKDAVYKDLTPFKSQTFRVNLTEQVGSAIWYRGYLENGKKVWIQAYNVTSEKPTITFQATSKLGRILEPSAVIYKTVGSSSGSFQAGTQYTDKVFYIKKQAAFDGQTYYLISTVASDTQGVVGWVNAKDMWAQNHVAVDHKEKLFYLKGTGWAYTNPWGAGKDAVYKDLTPFKSQTFRVNLTEQVGSAIWYRGYLENGKKVWIQAYNVVSSLDTSKYTYYDLTLDEAHTIQMKANPQTDKYSREPAYVSSSYIKVYTRGFIQGSGVNLRTTPDLKTDENIYEQVGYGTAFLLLDSNVIGDPFQGNTKWYKILYKNKELYVHSSLVRLDGKVGVVTADVLNVRANKSTNSHIYGKLYKGAEVTILEEGSDWHKIQYSYWRNATSEDVRNYLNPTHFVNDPVQKFQFLDLSKPSGATADILNRFLKGKGILENQGQAFIEAAKKHGLNDVYLMSHALLETGNGTSELAIGVQYNGKTVYNMYGIGAYDGNAVESGAQFAYTHGWFDPETAIVEGAAFIGNDYIKTGQNTLYKMRWNPAAMDKLGKANHQYATDIAWAAKQAKTMYELYQQLESTILVLDIPVYK